MKNNNAQDVYQLKHTLQKVKSFAKHYKRQNKMVYIPTTNDIKNQQALIGEFIIGFEQTCSMIRHAILNICYPVWTVIQNNNIETLLEGLTSDPLRKKLEALVFDNFQNENEMLALNKKLSDQFAKMISIRNSITHGSILIGWNNFDGKISNETFLLKHAKTTKSGIDRNAMIVNIKSMQRCNNQILLINSGYTILCVLTNKEIETESKKIYFNQLIDIIKEIGTISLDFENKIQK